jgi:hypothetical protein
MKISDLKPGQKVTFNKISYEYLGIHKVRIPNFGRTEKRVSKATNFDGYKYYNLIDGDKTLKSEKIRLIKETIRTK